MNKCRKGNRVARMGVTLRQGDKAAVVRAVGGGSLSGFVRQALAGVVNCPSLTRGLREAPGGGVGAGNHLVICLTPAERRAVWREARRRGLTPSALARLALSRATGGAVSPDAPRPRKPLAAWGEVKSLGEWVADPRFRAGRKNLAELRLSRGWTVEDALSTPPRGSIKNGGNGSCPCEAEHLPRPASPRPI